MMAKCEAMPIRETSTPPCMAALPNQPRATALPMVIGGAPDSTQATVKSNTPAVRPPATMAATIRRVREGAGAAVSDIVVHSPDVDRSQPRFRAGGKAGEIAPADALRASLAQMRKSPGGSLQ